MESCLSNQASWNPSKLVNDCKTPARFRSVMRFLRGKTRAKRASLFACQLTRMDPQL